MFEGNTIWLVLGAGFALFMFMGFLALIKNFYRKVDQGTALIINKMDLPGAEDVAAPLESLYRRIGYLVLPVSAVSREGLDRLHQELCRGSSTLIGPSGVGKSSLLNAIDPALELRTGELSRKGGTGRHTTVGSRIIPLACATAND